MSSYLRRDYAWESGDRRSSVVVKCTWVDYASRERPGSTGMPGPMVVDMTTFLM
jgi:hypothetical protein